MKFRTAVLALAMLVIALVALPQVFVVPSIYTAYLCVEDLVVVPEIPIWHPVGCEIVDCCPGCPGPGEIDWNIKVSGDPAERVLFEFERLPAEGAKKLSIKGNAKLIEGNRLEVGSGESLIGGFPADTRQGPVLGRGRILLNKTWLNEAAGKSKSAAEDKAPSQSDNRT